MRPCTLRRLAGLILAGPILSVSLAVSLAPSPVKAIEICPPAENIDLGYALHHDLTISFDPQSGQINGVDRMRLSGRGEVVFRLAAALKVSRIVVDGKNVEPERHGAGWRVDLGDPGTHRVVMEYAGRLKGVGTDRLKGVGTDRLENPGETHGFNYVVSEKGTFLPRSLDWMARIAGSEFTYRIALDVPSGQRALVPGKLIEEHVSEGRYRAIFASETFSGGVIFLAGPYQVSERWIDGIRVRTYFDPSVAALSDDYLDFSGRYISDYSKLIGPYPFSAFHIVSATLPVGLGYQNLTVIGARVLRLPFIRTTSLPHEVLHNWWGNGVYIDYQTGNWAEGLTTYMADYVYGGGGRDKRFRWLRDFAALPPARDRPLSEFVSKSHDASQVIGYNKSAFVFHMLRTSIGEDAFVAALRLFWSQYRYKEAGWKDLRRVFEETSGRELGRFFEQWLERTGAPRLSLVRASVQIMPDGRYRTTFTVRQTKPVYELTIPLIATTGTSQRRVLIKLDAAEQQASVITDAKPRSILLDPDHDVFRRLESLEMPPIMRDVTLARASVVIAATDPSVMDAARKLSGRLLDTAPVFSALDEPPPQGPLLIIGLTRAVSASLSQIGVPVPPQLAGRGTSRAWAGRDHQGRSFIAVAANDARSLAAIIGPLPHYLRRGFVVFNGRKAIDKGVWPGNAAGMMLPLD